jgi:hypothetical protein
MALFHKSLFPFMWLSVDIGNAKMKCIENNSTDLCRCTVSTVWKTTLFYDSLSRPFFARTKEQNESGCDVVVRFSGWTRQTLVKIDYVDVVVLDVANKRKT